MKMITNIIYPAFAVFALACFAVLPKAQAVNPPPDGCYPNFTTAEGCNALNLLTTGAGNTGVGWHSLLSDTTGSFNTGVGAGALILNNGDSNTAVGAVALLLNTTGTQNTAVGTDALVYNDTGSANTANGAFALFSNTAGDGNTAIGALTLFDNTEGDFNTAVGIGPLNHNTTGSSNVAVGGDALEFNTIGSGNTAVGTTTLDSNTEGNFNTAIGQEALTANTTGGNNTGLGWRALFSQTEAANNTSVGFLALASATGSENTALGSSAGFNLTDGDWNIDIGAEVVGVAGETNTIRIGNQGTQTATFIAGISGTAVVGDTVVVDANGQLGTAISSARFKKNIKPIENASEAILALKPVTFQYKSDSKSTPRFGLIAEEVAKVNPDLVVRDRDGEIYSVRYEAVNAMLLNEFLKEHRTVQELKSTVAVQEATISQQKQEFQAIATQQQNEIEALTASLKEQASQIQKVSAQLEVSRPGPQTASLPAVALREGGNNQ